MHGNSTLVDADAYEVIAEALMVIADRCLVFADVIRVSFNAS